MDTELDPVSDVSAVSVDAVYETLIERKGKRAQRRLDTALREPGRLRKWLDANDLRWWFVTYRNKALFKQQMRANRHSCHAMCCVERQHEKHRRNRRERYGIRDTISRIMKGREEVQ